MIFTAAKTPASLGQAEQWAVCDGQSLLLKVWSRQDDSPVLRDEHEFEGGVTVVKDAVRS